jgi:hypothetical protein
MKLPRADLRVSGVLAKPALLACSSDPICGPGAPSIRLTESQILLQRDGPH